jgi:hypothetical protein
MFSPGKKNWIKKFFSLVKQEEINLTASFHQTEENHEELLRELCEHTGILYGVPNKQLYTETYVGSATRNEKLQVLLFESLLFIDRLQQKDAFNEDQFIARVIDFYQIKAHGFDKKWHHLISKMEETNHLESFLSDRIKVHSSYSKKNFWFNHLTNGFLYLDLIQFYQSVEKGKPKDQEQYNEWVEAILTLITSINYIHPEAEKYFDQTMFKNLTLSAELPLESINNIKQGAEQDKKQREAIEIVSSEPMLAMFTFHFLVFLYHEYPSKLFTDDSFLHKFGKLIGLSEEQTTEVFWECRKSMSEHSSEFYHLVTESESKILTTHLSRKYYRILGRNKDRLIQELKESKELVYLVRQSTVRELTPEEKEKVKTQSMDLMKSVPSIGIYLIPGGALWLPLVLKLIPDLLPSAFKENEVEEKK